MGRWLLLLGGPLIWAAHFLAIYFIASLAEQLSGETGLIARALILAAGGVAIIAALLVLASARRLSTQNALDRFWRLIAQAGAVLAIIAVLWQSLPALAPI